MSEIGYNLLAILGGLILIGFSILGILGGEQAQQYQSTLLALGLVVSISLAFHLGTLWEKRKCEDRPRRA